MSGIGLVSFDGSPFDVGPTQQGEANGNNDSAENSVSQFGTDNNGVSLNIPENFFGTSGYVPSTSSDPYSGSASIDMSPATPSFSDQLKAFENNPLGAVLGDFGKIGSGAVGMVTGSGSSGGASAAPGFLGITVSRVITIVLGLMIFATGLFLLGGDKVFKIEGK